MSKPFSELRERLLEAGIAPRHVRRYLRELADHLSDLKAEEERSGQSRVDTESAALRRLGRIDDLASAMIERREFQSWAVRAPWARSDRISGSRVVGCFAHLVDWLEHFPAAGGLAIRSFNWSNVWSRERVFPSWQDDLFWRTHFRWVGDRNDRRPPKTENGVAPPRRRPRRADRQYSASARRTDRSP
jgi:hypothetical protein